MARSGPRFRVEVMLPEGKWGLWRDDLSYLKAQQIARRAVAIVSRWTYSGAANADVRIVPADASLAGVCRCR